MLEIGPKLGCKGCCSESGYHNKECRAGFNEKYDQKPEEPEKPADQSEEVAIGG